MNSTSVNLYGDEPRQTALDLQNFKCVMLLSVAEVNL